MTLTKALLLLWACCLFCLCLSDDTAPHSRGYQVPLTRRLKFGGTVSKRNGIAAPFETTQGSWAVGIYLGSTPEPLYVSLDTGSSDLIVTSQFCNVTDYGIELCGEYSYQPSLNVSYARCDDPVFPCATQYTPCIGGTCYGVDCYGDGSGAVSIVTSDFFGMPGLPYTVKTTFGSLMIPVGSNCDYQSISNLTIGPGFIESNFSGLFGVSYPGIASLGVNPPPLDSLLAANLLPNIFSLCVTNENPFMSVGADFYYNPTFTYTPIVSRQEFILDVSDFGLVGDSAGGASKIYNISAMNDGGTLLDSGTSQLLLNPELSDFLWTRMQEIFCPEGQPPQLPGICNETMDSSIFNGSFPLTQNELSLFPSFYFTFINGLQRFVATVTPQDYIFEVGPGSYSAMGISLNSSQTILGDVFMQNVHAVFDKSRGMIGLGPLSSCNIKSAVPPGSTTTTTTTTTSSATTSASTGGDGGGDGLSGGDIAAIVLGTILGPVAICLLIALIVIFFLYIEEKRKNNSYSRMRDLAAPLNA